MHANRWLPSPTIPQAVYKASTADHCCKQSHPYVTTQHFFSDNTGGWNLDETETTRASFLHPCKRQFKNSQNKFWLYRKAQQRQYNQKIHFTALKSDSLRKRHANTYYTTQTVQQVTLLGILPMACKGSSHHLRRPPGIWEIWCNNAARPEATAGRQWQWCCKCTLLQKRPRPPHKGATFQPHTTEKQPKVEAPIRACRQHGLSNTGGVGGVLYCTNHHHQTTFQHNATEKYSKTGVEIRARHHSFSMARGDIGPHQKSGFGR